MNIIEQNLESIYEIIYSTEYRQELKEIYYYIAIHLQEEVIAKKLVHKIQEEILDLSYMPRKYKRLKKTRNIGIHQRNVKNYNIIYQIDIKIKKVYILHIFYSRRNYLKLI